MVELALGEIRRWVDAPVAAPRPVVGVALLNIGRVAASAGAAHEAAVREEGALRVSYRLATPAQRLLDGREECGRDERFVRAAKGLPVVDDVAGVVGVVEDVFDRAAGDRSASVSILLCK